MNVHRPLVGVAIFLCIGIYVSSFVQWPWFILAGSCGLSWILSVIFLNRGKISNGFAAIGFIFLGMIILTNHNHKPKGHVDNVAKYYRSKPAFIEGIVVSDAVKKDFFRGVKTSFELEVKKIKAPWGWEDQTGKILVNIFRDVEVDYGDKIWVEGKLHEPFRFGGSGKFSYKRYLKHKGISRLLSVKRSADLEILDSNCGHPVMTVSLSIKNYLKEIIMRYLPDVEGGIMQALIIGDRYDIPKSINNLFIQTGTAHILAISGFNVGIVALIFLIFLKMLPLGRRWQYLITIILLWGYAFLTGLRPPVVRATIMASVFLLAYVIEREPDTLNSLSLAALLILLLNPNNLFDVGFQLSFISVLGIILLYAPVMQKLKKNSLISRSKVLNLLAQTFAVSLSAWSAVAGLLAYYFEIVTPVTVLANIVVVPLISFITVLGLGLLAFGFMPFMAVAFAACIKLSLNFTVGAIYVFSLCPGAFFYVKGFSIGMLAGYYAFLAVILIFAQHPRLTKNTNYDKVTPMKKMATLFIAFFLLCATPSFAFWIWTPETGKWVNPKYDVKDTPEEQLKFAMGHFTAKNYKKAVSEFEKLIRNYPKSKEAAEAQYHIGLAYEDQERLFEAYKAYQRVVEKYPFSERFSDVVEKEYQIGERFLNGEGKRGKFALTVLGGEYDVIEVFRTVIKNAPYGKYAAPSQYKIGLYLSQKGLFQEARDEFEKVINDYPTSEWVKPAKYQIAVVDSKRSTKAQYDQKVTKAAVEEFKEFARMYPDAELSEQAKKEVDILRDKEAENNFVIARFYEKQKNFDSARMYYRVVIDDYKDSVYAAKAVERIQIIELLEAKQKKK